MRPVCFFAGWPGAGDCDGALIRAHLLPRQLLKRTYPQGVVLYGGRWVDLRKVVDAPELPYRTLRELCDDERSWVPCCGGALGPSGHHGQLDQSRSLRIPRDKLPRAVEDFAHELDLSWWLVREYGEAVTT